MSAQEPPGFVWPLRSRIDLQTTNLCAMKSIVYRTTIVWSHAEAFFSTGIRISAGLGTRTDIQVALATCKPRQLNASPREQQADYDRPGQHMSTHIRLNRIRIGLAFMPAARRSNSISRTSLSSTTCGSTLSSTPRSNRPYGTKTREFVEKHSRFRLDYEAANNF